VLLYPHPRRAVGLQISLENRSGFPLTAFGAIMTDDHQISPIDLRRVRSRVSRAGHGGARKEADRLACDAWNKRMLGFPRSVTELSSIGSRARKHYDVVSHGRILKLPSTKPRLACRHQGLHKLSPDLISKAKEETATQISRIGLTFLGTSAFLSSVPAQC
jgi:hypothetical protein